MKRKRLPGGLCASSTVNRELSKLGGPWTGLPCRTHSWQAQGKGEEWETREKRSAPPPLSRILPIVHASRLLPFAGKPTEDARLIEVLSCSAWVYGLEFLCPFRRVNFWLKTLIEMLREIIRLIFSIYSVWSRNKTKAKLWYEFNHSSSPSRKWLDNACKYWMIISPPFLINYAKKLLILDKITGVLSFTKFQWIQFNIQNSEYSYYTIGTAYGFYMLQRPLRWKLNSRSRKFPQLVRKKKQLKERIGIRAIQLPSEIRCYLKNVEGLLQKGWRSDQSLIEFLLGCFLRHIVFRNKMLLSLKHYPGSDGDAYCHHQLRYMLDIKVPSFMQ